MCVCVFKKGTSSVYFSKLQAKAIYLIPALCWVNYTSKHDALHDEKVQNHEKCMALVHRFASKPGFMSLYFAAVGTREISFNIKNGCISKQAECQVSYTISLEM